MDTEFFRVLEHPRHTNGLTVYHLEHELDLLSELHKGGEGLIPEPTDMPVQLHDSPDSHTPRPARPGLRAPIAL